MNKALLTFIFVALTLFSCGQKDDQKNHKTMEDIINTSWRYLKLDYSQSKSFVIFFNQFRENEFEVAIYKNMESLNECLQYDRLIGSVSALKISQIGNSLKMNNFNGDLLLKDQRNKWSEIRRRNSAFPQNTIDYLKYHLANMRIMLDFDSSMSKESNSKIIGVWQDDDIIISFHQDGSYLISKEPSKCESLMGAPLTGTWSVTDSNLFLMNPSNTNGLRVQILKISDQILVLPGQKFFLTYVLTRKEQ